MYILYKVLLSPMFYISSSIQPYEAKIQRGFLSYQVDDCFCLEWDPTVSTWYDRIADWLEEPNENLSIVLLQKYLSWLHNRLLREFCGHNNFNDVNVAVPICLYPFLHFVWFCLCNAVAPEKPDFEFMSPDFFLYLMILLLRGQPKHHFLSVHVSYCEC